jgi:hypothetical protein
VATITVRVAGNETAIENGTVIVPADAEVVLDATGSLGDISSYNWEIGEMSYPNATITHVFAAGTSLVNLVVMANDGRQNATLLNVTAVAGIAVDTEVMISSTPISFSMAATNIANTCAHADQALTFPAGTVTRHVTMVLDPTWTQTAINIAFHIYLMDTAGTIVARADRSSGNANLVLDVGDLNLAPGAYTARGEICALIVVGASFAMTGQADHYA